MLAVAAQVWAASAVFPPPEMIGEWQGDGKIVVTWCKQDRLAIRLYIRADGKVSGMVGDAIITDGSVRKNNWFLDWMGNPEYVIEARLDGPIVEAEGIRRESIELLLDIDGHELLGGFHTNGSKTGGKESMIMTVTPLRLSRVQRLNTEIGQIRLPQFIGEKRVGDRQVCGVGLREEYPLPQRADHHNKPQIRGQIG
jgi:hypothetical protein